ANAHRIQIVGCDDAEIAPRILDLRLAIDGQPEAVTASAKGQLQRGGRGANAWELIDLAERSLDRLTSLRRCEIRASHRVDDDDAIGIDARIHGVEVVDAANQERRTGSDEHS